MGITEVIVFSLTAGFGWAIISYASYANIRGWPVGLWLAGDFSWLQGLAYLALMLGVGGAMYAGPWWYGIVVLVVANVIVKVLFPVVGPRAQLVSTLGVLVGLPVSAALVWL